MTTKLTPARRRVLAVLSRTRPMRIREISDRLGRSPAWGQQTCWSMLKALVLAGLAESTPAGYRLTRRAVVGRRTEYVGIYTELAEARP